MRLRLPAFSHRAEPILLVVILLMAVAGMVIVLLVVLRTPRSPDATSPAPGAAARRAAHFPGAALPPPAELRHIQGSRRSHA